MRQLKSFFWRHNKYLARYLLKYLHAKYSTPIFEADSWGWSLQTYEVKESGLSNLRSLDKTRFSTWERKQWLCRVGGAKWPIICKLSSSLCWLLKEKMVTKEIWKLKRLVLKQQKITWEEQYLLKRISAHRERLGRVPHSPCVLEIVSNLAKSRGHPGVEICGTRLHGWLPLSSLTLVYLGAGATHWIAVLVAGPEPSRPAFGGSADQAAWAPPAASGPLEHYPLQSSCLWPTWSWLSSASLVSASTKHQS